MNYVAGGRQDSVPPHQQGKVSAADCFSEKLASAVKVSMEVRSFGSTAAVLVFRRGRQAGRPEEGGEGGGVSLQCRCRLREGRVWALHCRHCISGVAYLLQHN